VLALLYLAGTAIAWRRTLINTETWALYHAGKTFARQMQAVRSDLVHPPLIYLVQRAWLRVAGKTDNSAKALPMLFCIPAILVYTFLATRVTPRWKLLALLLVIPFLRPGSAVTQVRMYGLALLLAGLALVLWDRWRESPTSARLAAWWVVTTALVYTHVFGSLLLLAFFLINWFWGRRRIAFNVACGASALALLPWILYVLPVYFSRGFGPNLSWASPTILGGLGGLPYGFSGIVFVRSYKLLLAAKFFVLALHLPLLYMLYRARRRLLAPATPEEQEAARWFRVALLIFGVPIAMAVIYSMVSRPAIETRFLLGALPGYLILVFLICNLGGKTGRVVLLGLFLPWMIVSVASHVSHFRVYGRHYQWAKLAAEHAQKGDLLLFEDANDGGGAYWELTRRFGKEARMITLPAGDPISSAMAIVPARRLEEIDFSGATRVWFLERLHRTEEKVRERLRSLGFEETSLNAPGARGVKVFERQQERAPSGSRPEHCSGSAAPPSGLGA
jgi:hypothetical protein